MDRLKYIRKCTYKSCDAIFFAILKRKYYNTYGIGDENTNAWANSTKEDFEKYFF